MKSPPPPPPPPPKKKKKKVNLAYDYNANNPNVLPNTLHDDFIKRNHFPRYWHFVQGICYWRNGWVNDREAGDLKCHRAHYDVTIMKTFCADLENIRGSDFVISLMEMAWHRTVLDHQ